MYYIATHSLNKALVTNGMPAKNGTHSIFSVTSGRLKKKITVAVKVLHQSCIAYADPGSF